MSGSTRTETIAQLITKQTLTKIQPPITVRITAQDEWNPPKRSQATITIAGDPVISFVTPPEFEQNLYQTVLKIGDNFTPIRMNLLANTYDSTVGFVASGEDADYFTFTPASDRSSVTVALRTGAQIDVGKKLLSLTVIASRSGTQNVGRTALVVELLQEPKIIPTFEASLYTGTIDRNKVINIGSIKLLPDTSDSSVRVQLSGEDSQYFTLTFANNQAALAPSRTLSDAVLKEKNFFIVTLQAEKVDVGIGEALIVLSVEKRNAKDPQFEQTVYEGTITETGSLNVPTTIRISPESFVDGLKYSYSGDTALLLASSDGSGTITIASNNITPDKLTDKSYVLLSIIAQLEDEEIAHTVVILKVLRTAIIMPKFAEHFLEGELTLKTLEVKLPNVEILVDTYSTDTSVRIIDDRYFFDIVEYFPENVFKVTLRLNVTREMLLQIDRLSLRVEAQNPNSEMSYCFITLDVVRDAPPAFERLIYDGLIDETKQLVQEIVAILTPQSAAENIVYTLEGEDEGFFVIKNEVPATDGVRIVLKSPLSDEEFESRTRFLLSLKATNTMLSQKTVVPVVVYVKHSLVKIPKFEKPLYKSRINTALELVPFEQIRLEPGSYEVTASVAIRYNNNEFFGVRLQNGIVTIQLLKELDEATVTGVDRFEFVIECINPDSTSGFATIIIDIDRTIAPQFSDRFYAGEVREDSKEIKFSNPITLQPPTIVSDTVYELEGIDSALVRHVVLDDQSLSFFLRDEITKEQLKSRSEIGFIIVATNPGNNQPAFAPCTVKIVREVKPVFTRASFRGKIVEDTTVVNFGSLPIAWEIDSVQNTVLFTIVDAIPNSLFEAKLSQDGKTVDIILKSDVNWDQVRSVAYYQLILQAANPGSDAAQCTLVIDVENLPTITPTFTKAIYRGSLQEGARDVQFSAADTITVQPGTIMSSFRYSVMEGDANLFEVAQVDDNKFKVSLKDTIAPSVIEGRDMLSFIITISNAYSADDTATIVITIKLDDIIIPTFSKLLYSGSILEGTNVLRLQESIVLSAGTFTENTDIGVGGTDAALFTVSRLGSEVDLGILNDAVDWTELVSKQYLSIYVQATNPGSETATSFVVIQIELLSKPEFVHSSSHGYIEAGERDVRFLEGSELRIVSESTEPGYQWNLAGDDYQLFDGSLVDDLFTFNLKESITEELLRLRTIFNFKVTLKNPTGGTVDSVVVVNRRIPMPRFSKNIYTGSFGSDLLPSLTDAIQITETSFTNGILITILESNVDFVALDQTERSVQLKLSRSITIDDFQGLEVVRLVLLAKASEDTWSTCSIVLAVPEGTPCNPLPPVVDCSSCYNCTTGGIYEDVPMFAYGNFRFQLRSDTTGVIGTVVATVKDPTAVVQHSLDVEDEYLKAQLSITTEGRLTIEHPIIPNVYQFFVHATNVAAGKRATANVWLDVLNQYECTEGEKQVVVDQVLFVQHLDEERPHATIFSTQLSESCAYELIGEHPVADDQQDPYFYIDLETNWLASRSFDRENEQLFENMDVPQFKLVLKLKCQESEPTAAENEVRSVVKRSLVETDTINYAPDITIVSIIVNDVNDNDPIFIEPEPKTGSRIWLGFPEPSLANRLMLSGLVDVVATDADVDLNAKIRYSLEGNDHFTIHPETGSIKPTKDSLRAANLVDLTVIATDRDGAVDGRSSRLDISVYRLEENQIAFITLAAADEVSAEEMIEQVNRESSFHLKVLHQTKVPEMEISNGRKIIDESVKIIQATMSNMRLIVYALNNNNDQLLTTNDIRDGIRAVFPNIQPTAIESFSNAICYGNKTDSSCPFDCPGELMDGYSNTGLIASTSVLGGLLLICISVTIVLYLRYVRPLAKGTDNNPSDLVQLENDFDSTPPSTSPSLGVKKERSADDTDITNDRKISINISGITMQESEDTNNDGGSRLARILGERLDEEDEYGAATSGISQETVSEPKNVKFNEVVERIEVQDHHSDDDGGSSVYEERL
uniref:Cadherin domain-containing protein n=1 Tax=Anopheles epiroticus TaxID=199890 RepID=A0A182PLD8_9DIPT